MRRERKRAWREAGEGRAINITADDGVRVMRNKEWNDFDVRESE